MFKLSGSAKTAMMLVVIAFAAVGFSYYLVKESEITVPNPITGKLVITNVNITENTVFVGSTETTATEISFFVVKDQSGGIVLSDGNVAEDAKVPAFSTKAIILATDLSALPKGNYTLTLVTTKGYPFVSPQFTVP